MESLKRIATALFLWMSIAFANEAYAQYNGPALKLPMYQGDGILCTVETGGPDMWGGTDGFHVSTFYALDFDDNRSPGNEMVLAAADGVVSNVLKTGCVKGGSSCFVQIEHSGGYVTEYRHQFADTIPAELVAGARVKQGDFLGIVGNTGESFGGNPSDPYSGTHLHFAIFFPKEDKLQSKNDMPELQGVTLEGIRFVDYVAGQTYQSTNTGTTLLTSVFCNGSLDNDCAPNYKVTCNPIINTPFEFDPTGVVARFAPGEDIILNAKFGNVYEKVKLKFKKTLPLF